MARKVRKVKKFNIFIMYCVLIALAITMTVQTSKLTTKTKSLEARERKIDATIAEQENKKLNLEDRLNYINTRKYIEEQAREKLGLLYPNEIIIKEKD